MSPSDQEITLAMEGAARLVYDERRGMMIAQGETMPTWEELPPMARHAILDSVNHVVWAALQALPDRLFVIRQLMHEVDPARPEDMLEFHAMVTRVLSGSPE